ncbi:MAG: UDP-glucose/GDP-mannose dehydrogenase family protein [Verrucomicrobiota bacterium]|jgi:UDPglucose 6-dehydrogenase/GDP-mannose 6-dehydrogenase
MKLTIIGTGYVGLVSGVCLASKGHDVTCLDLRQEVVESLNRGKPHIHEKGLASLLRNVLKSQCFQAKKADVAAFNDSELVIIAVGTPSHKGKINLAHIQSAAKLAGNYLRRAKRFVSVIVKSTVVPGTTDTFVRKILERSSGKKLGAFGLGMNPEFLREGAAVEDFLAPDRIVLGHETPETLRHLEKLYAPWDCDKLCVNSRTAEMIKYSNNCLLATQISAVNELANLASALGGIDILDVMRAIHLDRRWNPILADGRRVNPQILTYLVPGCGFGGSCFPKDVQALYSCGRIKDLEMRLLKAVLEINESQPLQVIAGLKRHLGSLHGKQFLILGLAFKPGTDDVRESPARKIIRALLAEGARVSAHDPVAADSAHRAWPELAVEYVTDWESALPQIVAALVVTAWPEYERLTAPCNLQILRGKCVFDNRRMFQPDAFTGATYLTIGREM